MTEEKTNWTSSFHMSPRVIICCLGGLSTTLAVLQIVPYTIFLRAACTNGAIDYIWVFTCLGCLNFIYIWHNIRLLFMLHRKTFSRRSSASSQMWFCSGLAYVIITTVQVVWWAYCRDYAPLITSAVSLPFSIIFFVYGARKLHALRNARERKNQARLNSTAAETELPQ